MTTRLTWANTWNMTKGSCSVVGFCREGYAWYALPNTAASGENNGLFWGDGIAQYVLCWHSVYVRTSMHMGRRLTWPTGWRLQKTRSARAQKLGGKE